jgi:AcrR family transcriptional regulator
MNLRDRKKLQTRERLVAAAIDLFEEKGYEATTVADITAAVDMSPRTFFRYFDSKEDVVFSGEDEALAWLKVAIEGRPVGEPQFSALRSVLIDFACSLEARLDEFRRRARVIRAHEQLRLRSAKLRGLWSRELAATLAAREGRSRGDPEDALMVSVALCVFDSAFAEWASGAMTDSFADRLRDHFCAIERAVCADTA